MFDNVIAKPNSSIAVEQAEELYRKVIMDVMQSNNNLWKVDKYLESIKLVDECFDYFIARDQQTGSPTMVIWPVESGQP